MHFDLAVRGVETPATPYPVHHSTGGLQFPRRVRRRLATLFLQAALGFSGALE
jgi:hypothetical protein